MPFQHGAILFGIAGIARKILLRCELRGIHEGADDNLAGPCAGLAGKRQMTLVERTHGGHQGDAVTGAPPPCESLAQSGCRPGNRYFRSGRRHVWTVTRGTAFTLSCSPAQSLDPRTALTRIREWKICARRFPPLILPTRTAFSKV